LRALVLVDDTGFQSEIQVCYNIVCFHSYVYKTMLVQAFIVSGKCGITGP
jgi:hypothetical protein